jgi:hypothetical protein
MQKTGKYLFSFIFILTCFSSCRDDRNDIQETIIAVKNYFAPDARTAIFEIHFRKQEGNYILFGETDKREAVEALLDSLEKLDYNYQNNITILPAEQLHDTPRGAVNVSVANVRKVPSHSSELVTQAILGTSVRVLKQIGSWYLIQTPDKYIGWVDNGGIYLQSKDEYNDFLHKEKIIFTKIYGFSYHEPAESATTISDLTSGNILLLEEINEFYYKVSYPDGRSGYVKKSESEIFSEWLEKTWPNPDRLTAIAVQFTGVPYLWGGTSPKAMDCSGFTKIVYFLNGLVLPRDASQQVHLGMLVDEKKSFNMLQTGDLLFFGTPATDSTAERVVHVGMWIGDMKFIHASGDVHTSSMDPDSPLFDEYNLNRYLRTKRLIGAKEVHDLTVMETYYGNP